MPTRTLNVPPCADPNCVDPYGGMVTPGCGTPARRRLETLGLSGLYCKRCTDRILGRYGRGFRGAKLLLPPGQTRPRTGRRRPGPPSPPVLTAAEIAAAVANRPTPLADAKRLQAANESVRLVDPFFSASAFRGRLVTVLAVRDFRLARKSARSLLAC